MAETQHESSATPTTSDQIPVCDDRDGVMIRLNRSLPFKLNDRHAFSQGGGKFKRTTLLTYLRTNFNPQGALANSNN
jgi:hypothetical protein